MSKEGNQQVKSNRYASIDIGTNSVLLLVADWDGCQLTPHRELFQITRLGAAYTQEGIIPASAVMRTQQVLQQYIQEAREAGAREVWATATQIFRVAQNASAVLVQLQQASGISIEVLSREQEAWLTFWGALDTMAGLHGPFWAIDIGGGSTEVVLGDRHEIEFAYSFPFGAVQLKEHFHLEDNLKETDIHALRQFVAQQFQKHLPLKDGDPIGIGGTPTTLAALQQQLSHYAFDRIDGFHLSRSNVLQLFHQMNALPLAERMNLPGMEKGRADIILPATLVLDEFLKAIHRAELTVSARGLRYGVILWKLGVVSA